MNNIISQTAYYLQLKGKSIKQDIIIWNLKRKLECLEKQNQESRRTIWAGKMYIANNPDCPKAKNLEKEWAELEKELGIKI